MSDKQKNMTLYILLLIGVVLGCAPDMSMQVFSALLGAFTLVLAYVMRSREEKDNLVHHHSTFVIRTIWIWSLFIIIGTIGGMITIQSSADMSMIQDLLNRVNGGYIPDESDLQKVMESYMSVNHKLILTTTIAWMAPAQVYAVWRIFKGLSRASQGYRLQNLRGWF